MPLPASVSHAGKSVFASMPDADAMTIGFSELGLITQACAQLIRSSRIAQTEVVADGSLRPTSGFAVRRRAPKSARIGMARRLIHSAGHQLAVRSL